MLYAGVFFNAAFNAGHPVNAAEAAAAQIFFGIPFAEKRFKPFDGLHYYLLLYCLYRQSVLLIS